MRIRWSFVLLVTLLAGCGGGGSGGGGSGGASAPPQPTLSLPSTTVNFEAASPNAAIPLAQTVTANFTNVTSGTLFVIVEVADPSIVTVSSFVANSDTSGSAQFSVPYPATTGMGMHTTTVRVTACLNDPQCQTGRLVGSPQTITVNYRVGSPVQQNTLMPALLVASAPGRVVLRGTGLSDVTGVRFGGIDATAVSVVNDTEVRVDVPLLAAGDHPVTLVRGGASTDFQRSLRVVDAFTHAPANWALPSSPDFRNAVVGLSHDAIRQALVIGTSTNSTVPGNAVPTPANDRILRYALQGGVWVAAGARALPNLRYLAFSPDRQTLFAADQTTIYRLDPVTLDTLGSATKPFVDRESISGFAFTGDGQLLVTTGLEGGSGATTVYAHSLRDFTFAVPKLRGSGQSADNGFSFAWAGASGDGRIAVLRSLGDSRSYQAGAGKWAQITESIGSVGSLTSTIATPLLDETGSRIVIEEQNPGSFAGDWGVFDGTFVRRGYAGIAGESIALSRSGHRLYVLANDFASSPSCSVRAVDLDSPPLTGAGSYPEIVSGGFPIARACQNGIVDRSLAAIAPDDRTLFVAGGLGVSVIPLP